MNITILCSSKEHPVYPYLDNWVKKHSTSHNISLLKNLDDVIGGDLLFLISFTKIVKHNIRKKFKHSLVIHASDLPKGRGWSPLVWQILQGCTKITVTLFEAVDEVDAGIIWKKDTFEVERHELFDEINEKLFKAELNLMDFALKNFDKINPYSQDENDATYFERRKPEDSELDPHKTIVEQFNLLRIADINRYPCFFYLNGNRYKLTIQKF